MALQKPKRARAKKAGRISFSKIAYNAPKPCLVWLFNTHSTCQIEQGLC